MRVLCYTPDARGTCESIDGRPGQRSGTACTDGGKGDPADRPGIDLLWIGSLQTACVTRVTAQAGRYKRSGMDTAALCLSFKIPFGDIGCDTGAGQYL